MAAATSASAVGSTRRATQPSSAGPPLPVYQPTERDCYLYEAVQIEGLSSRQAAQRFGISQTRVQQIRRQMTEWLAVMAGPETGLSPAERICAGIDLAERRCSYLYSEAMEAWRASQEPQVSTRLGPGGHELKTTTLKSGDPRYLWMAMRMNTQMLHILGMAKKLLSDDFAPLFGPGDQALLNEPEVTGKRTRAKGDDADGEASSPPVGDCSPQAAEQGAAADEVENAGDVSPVEPTRSEVREARRQAMIAAYHRELETVQQAEEAEREQARQTVAAILEAEQEREETRANRPSRAKDRDEGDRDELCASPADLGVTAAEIDTEEETIQMLRQMDPIEANRLLMASARAAADASDPLEFRRVAPVERLRHAAELARAEEQQRDTSRRKERRARQKLLARKLRKAK